MSVLLIDNYDSFTYNLYQLVQKLSKEEVVVYRNDKITFADLIEKQPSHIILSPGPGHPGKLKDFGVCTEIIRSQNLLSCPVLGVCLGHQGIVHHCGGEISQAPEIVHGKISTIYITEPSRLFEGLPTQFMAMRYHSLIASEAKLPSNFTITARNSKGSIMAVEDTKKKMYGLQFHPESIGTPYGERLIQNFLQIN